VPSSALRALRALIATADTASQNQQVTNLQNGCCTNGSAIGVGKEDVLAPIATLGYVVGNSRVYGSGLPWHGEKTNTSIGTLKRVASPFPQIKVMFVAIVVAAVGLWLFEVAGWLRFDALKVQTTFFWAMAVGGALLGAGLAIGGYCPGTSVVGLFSGRLDALLFMLSILIGTLLFAANFDLLQGFYQAGQGTKGQTLVALTGWPTWLILLLLAGLAAAGFRLGAWFEARRGGVISAKELAE